LPFGNGRSLQIQKFVLSPCQIYEFILREWYKICEKILQKSVVFE